MCDKVLLRFQCRELAIDIHLDDINKVNLLDLALDWEDECMKLGPPMPANPSFWYCHRKRLGIYRMTMI